MENRERDRVSKRDSSTEAGEINRQTELDRGQQSGKGAEFGQNTGRSENLEGGSMENKYDENVKNKNLGNESSRKSGSGEFGSSSGRSGSMGKQSEISRDQSPGRRGSSGELGNEDIGTSRSSGEGRH
jgi:hypothetical protein